jgi:hypothetical protein
VGVFANCNAQHPYFEILKNIVAAPARAREMMRFRPWLRLRYTEKNAEVDLKKKF